MDLSLDHTHTHTHLTRAHTHTHTLNAHTHAHTHTLSLSLSLFLGCLLALCCFRRHLHRQTGTQTLETLVGSSWALGEFRRDSFAVARRPPPRRPRRAPDGATPIPPPFARLYQRWAVRAIVPCAFRVARGLRRAVVRGVVCLFSVCSRACVALWTLARVCCLPFEGSQIPSRSLSPLFHTQPHNRLTLTCSPTWLTWDSRRTRRGPRSSVRLATRPER